MVVYEKIISLTEDEVKKCSRERNGVVSLITANLTDIEVGEGKTSYKEVFRNKLTDSVDARSEFTFVEPPRSSSMKNNSFYVQCDHRKGKGLKPMAVSFAKADHIIGKALQLKFKSICDLCEGIAVTINKSNNSGTAQTVTIDGNAGFSGAFKAIRDRFGDMLNKIESECCKSANPIQHLRNNMAKFGLDANSTMIDGISVVIGTSMALDIATSSGSSTIVTPVTSSSLSSVVIRHQADASQTTSPSIVNPRTPSLPSATLSAVSNTTVTEVISPSSFVVMQQASFSSPSGVYPMTPSSSLVTSSGTFVSSAPQTRISFSSISPFSPVRNVSVTNSLSTTPIMTTSIASAEKLAIQAASDVQYQETPKSNAKRSAKAVLAQRFQENNIAKKYRGA